MKWIATILLIYMTALFVVPCSDGDNTCQDSRPVSSSSHNHSQDNDDNCSPFCQCTCCSVSIATFNFKLPEFKAPLPAFTVEENAVREDQFISSYSGNIWQPPKCKA